MSNKAQILMLQLHSAVSSKRLLATRAESDIAKFGEWTCNYDEPTALIDAEIEATVKMLCALEADHE